MFPIECRNLNVLVTVGNDGLEGLESKSELTINSGEIYAYAYDEAINAAEGIVVNGCCIYAYSVNNDSTVTPFVCNDLTSGIL